MKHKWIPADSIAEDGHPCEAAMEFRRAVILCELTDEVSADALDLAIAFAWIGKAVSRTVEAGAWVLAGTDPNTWQIIRAMALDAESRKLAYNTAVAAAAASGRESALKSLRSTVGFAAAKAQTKTTIEVSSNSSELERLAILSSLSKRLPGPKAFPVRSAKSHNVLILNSYRKLRR